MRTIRFDAEAIERYLWRVQSAKAGMDAALSTLGQLRLNLLAQADQASANGHFYQLIERLNRRIREAEKVYDETDRLIRMLRKVRELFEDAERKARELATDPALRGRSFEEIVGGGRPIPDVIGNTGFETRQSPDPLAIARRLVFSELDQVFTAQLRVPQGAPQFPEFLRRAP